MCNLPDRKSPRLPDYDYSSAGAYFITICIKDRKHVLGEIVGNGACDIPQILLSEYGIILDKYIRFMNEKYPHMYVDKYVIMPNHFHLIICITDDCKNGASETAAPYNNALSKFVSLLKRYCNREYGKNIFQKSFHDHIIRDTADYLKIWEYIDNNVARWEQDCFYTKND